MRPSEFPSYPSSLKEKTARLTLERLKIITLKDLSEQTGLSQTWLRMMANNKLKLADVGKTQKLYEFLTNRKLEV